MAQRSGEISMLDITDIATWERSEERVIELLDSDLGTIGSYLCERPALESLEALLMDRM